MVHEIRERTSVTSRAVVCASGEGGRGIVGDEKIHID